MYEKNTRPVIKHDFSGVQNKPKIQQIFISQKLVSSQDHTHTSWIVEVEEEEDMSNE